MPVFKQENLWAKPADGSEFIWLVTTNGLIARNGLVMGAGAALQAMRRFASIRIDAAEAIKKTGVRLPSGLWEYKLAIVYPPSEAGGLGLFQTKFEPAHYSRLQLIEQASEELYAYASANRQVQIRLNFPGIGLGGLSTDSVRPALEKLPENVIICYR